MRPRSSAKRTGRLVVKAVAVIAALVACFVGSPVAGAVPGQEVGHFSSVDPIGPEVISDLPCLEGKEFMLTGSVSSRGSFVNSVDFFHFTGMEQFSATLVPVDGQGPTYVERNRPAHITLTARRVSGFINLVQTEVNNDRFDAYVDGKRVSSATIRIHEVQHFVGSDTDGDNFPDVFKVSVTVDKVSCPA
jgi:hypothetical protein